MMNAIKEWWARVNGCTHKGLIEILGEHEGCDVVRCTRCNMTYNYPG